MSRRYRVVPEGGICPDAISFTLDAGERVRDLVFDGGCDGNARGLARLAEGRPARELADLLAGVGCEGKGTSCPDQFSRALAAALDGRLAPQ